MTNGELAGLKLRTFDTFVIVEREGRPKPMSKLEELLQRFCYNSQVAPTEQVEALYMCWLYGATSRQLGKLLSCDKNKVVSMFEQRYGEDAGNCGAKSLLKSLAQDYPNCPTVEKFIRDNIAIKEKSHGTEVTMYTSVYKDGRVVTKVREQRVYTRHRSKHSIACLTRAQCRNDLWLQLSEYVGVEDGDVESGESQEPIV